MKLDQLGKQMRRYEKANANVVLPGLFIVARVDGRSFTRLTKETRVFDAPYDERFRDYMLETAKALMRCGPSIRYAYTQSDEISLLFQRDDDSFGRRLDKLNSILAGVASSAFTLALGACATFDCRVSQLPGTQEVVDYFRWRQADAKRNAISAHSYWMLRRRGLSVREATERLVGMSERARQDLMFNGGTNFNDIPSWQKRGIGLVWQNTERAATDPRTAASVVAVRRELTVETELPYRDDYDRYLRDLVDPGDRGSRL